MPPFSVRHFNPPPSLRRRRAGQIFPAISPPCRKIIKAADTRHSYELNNAALLKDRATFIPRREPLRSGTSPATPFFACAPMSLQEVIEYDETKRPGTTTQTDSRRCPFARADAARRFDRSAFLRWPVEGRRDGRVSHQSGSGHGRTRDGRQALVNFRPPRSPHRRARAQTSHGLKRKSPRPGSSRPPLFCAPP